MRPVLVWRIRGASCSSFRWLRNSRKRALPRVVVHSVSILFLLQLTPLPRYGVLQLTAGFTGFSAHKRVLPLATAQLICADANIPANCGMNDQAADATAARPGNSRNGTAPSTLPHPDAAIVPAGAKQTLNRPECEYADPATSARSGIIHASEAEVQIHPSCSLSLFRFFELSAKSCPHPNPSPVNGRGARNASAASALRAHAILALSRTWESGPQCVGCECKQSWSLSRARERGWGEGKPLNFSSWPLTPGFRLF